MVDWIKQDSNTRRKGPSKVKVRIPIEKAEEPTPVVGRGMYPHGFGHSTCSSLCIANFSGGLSTLVKFTLNNSISTSFKIN